MSVAIGGMYSKLKKKFENIITHCCLKICATDDESGLEITRGEGRCVQGDTRGSTAHRKRKLPLFKLFES